jgi:hypothetical protein
VALVPMYKFKTGLRTALSKTDKEVNQLTSNQSQICEDYEQITKYLDTDCTLDCVLWLRSFNVKQHGSKTWTSYTSHKGARGGAVGCTALQA